MLRAECIYIRQTAMRRIHGLVDRLRQFCAIQKECGVLLNEWEGLCHIEDIMREEEVKVVSSTSISQVSYQSQTTGHGHHHKK